MAEKKKIYLICGDEELKKEQKKKQLLSYYKAEGSPDFNSFSGSDIDLNEVSSLSLTVPFFSAVRVILLDDTGFFKANKKAAAEADGDETQDGMSDSQETDSDEPAPPQASVSSDDLLELLDGITDTCALIFTEKNVSAASKGYKYIKEHGEILEYKSLESTKGSNAKNDLRFKIRDDAGRYIASCGRSIDNRTLSYLLELTGYDMLNLKTEADKLIAYTKDRITIKDIDDITSKTITDRVFDMIDLKLSGNISGAIKMFEEMMAIKVAPMKVIYLMSRRFKQVFILRDLEANRKSDAEIMNHMGLKDWQLRNLRKAAKNNSASDMLKLIELCTEMEYKYKSGDMPERIAAEIIICS
ncbi:MAG: DNA polymerase III subunit delta [Eubacteriales bacterium]|nr:DNA polymerase III subunit delta [Eubacteriales bacterium]